MVWLCYFCASRPGSAATVKSAGFPSGAVHSAVSEELITGWRRLFDELLINTRSCNDPLLSARTDGRLFSDWRRGTSSHGCGFVTSVNVTMCSFLLEIPWKHQTVQLRDTRRLNPDIWQTTHARGMTLLRIYTDLCIFWPEVGPVWNVAIFIYT